MKGAEFHRNIFSGNHVEEGGECYLVQGVSRCLMYDQNLFCFVCRSLFVAAV